MPTTRKPQPPLYPYNVNARLAPHHYAYLLAIAEGEDVGLSEALRRVLDALLEAESVEGFSGDLAQLLRHAVNIQPDPAWLARHGDES